MFRLDECGGDFFVKGAGGRWPALALTEELGHLNSSGIEAYPVKPLLLPGLLGDGL